MSAQRCCTAWNAPIGWSNCRRSFAYSTASSSARAAAPTPSTTMAIPIRSTTSATVAVASPVPMPSCRRAVEGDGRDPAGAVDGLLWSHDESRRIGGHEEHAELAVRCGGHEDDVRCERVGDVHLHARHYPTLTVCIGACLRFEPGPTAVRFVERDRADGLAGCQPGKVVVAHRVGTRERDQARSADRTREERAGMQRAAHLLDDDGNVDHAHAGPTERLGNQQAGDAQLAQRGPDLGARAARIIEHRAHVRADRRPLGQEPPDRVAQQLLVG